MAKIPWLGNCPERSHPGWTEPPLVPLPESSPCHPSPRQEGEGFTEAGESPEQIYLSFDKLVQDILQSGVLNFHQKVSVIAVVPNGSDVEGKLLESSLCAERGSHLKSSGSALQRGTVGSRAGEEHGGNRWPGEGGRHLPTGSSVQVGGPGPQGAWGPGWWGQLAPHPRCSACSWRATFSSSASMADRLSSSWS